MEQVIDVSNVSKADLLKMTETEIFDFIIDTAEGDAGDELLAQLDTLTDTQATRLRYNTVKRFQESNKKPTKCRGVYTLRDYFSDFDGMVFGLNTTVASSLSIVDMYLFKGTSTKVFESEWANEGSAKNHAVKKWSSSIRNKISQDALANKNRREEEAEMLQWVSVGSIFAVLTVMADQTPGSAYAPREFYQVVEIKSLYTVILKKLETIVPIGDVAKPVIDSFVGKPIEKRLATGTFFGVGGMDGYRYLRFGAGCRDTHAYLVKKSTTDDQYRPIKKLIESQPTH